MCIPHSIHLQCLMKRLHACVSAQQIRHHLNPNFDAKTPLFQLAPSDNALYLTFFENVNYRIDEDVLKTCINAQRKIK